MLRDLADLDLTNVDAFSSFSKKMDEFLGKLESSKLSEDKLNYSDQLLFDSLGDLKDSLKAGIQEKIDALNEGSEGFEESIKNLLSKSNEDIKFSYNSDSVTISFSRLGGRRGFRGRALRNYSLTLDNNNQS